jgi:DNA-binding transcriptional ArsR family regulator
MKEYREIRVWDFPATRTHIYLNTYRKKLIEEFISKCGTWKKAIEIINKKAKKYKISKKYSVGELFHWSKGIETKRKKERRVPLWVLLEISKTLSNRKKNNNYILREIEKNIIYCCSRAGKPIKIKFPIYMTPELVSIIFHFCGDGHLGGKGKQAHYRQVNKQGLENFIKKLKNCFGKFNINQTALADSKILIPALIPDFCRHFFKLNNCSWKTARIPKEIKKLDKEFLVAGLTAFLIDEGHIGDSIEIYSSNKELLEDIKEIGNSLGYLCRGPKVKSRNHTKDFRVYISNKSANKLFEDIKKISAIFPTCDLAHKQDYLQDIVQRQKFKALKKGVTKNKILKMISKKQLSVREMCKILKISPSSLREHLKFLEQKGLIIRITKKGIHATLWTKIS